MKPTFAKGDRIAISSASLDRTMKAEILALRHAVGNHRTGSLSMGADVLREDGKVQFYYLHDIVRWNPEIIKESFK